MRGKIIKGVGGFYYVQTPGAVYECRAKGIFRKDGVKPLVGDNVEMAVLDPAKKTGNIQGLLPRKNALIRPAVANIDQALVIFALTQPKPNLHLLDAFLVSIAQRAVPAILCFNKRDMAGDGQCRELLKIYQNAGCPVLFTSALQKEGVEELRTLLRGKTTAVAGPSGVGKSSLVNLLAPGARMETGAVSRKTDRGRHTTRHSEILTVEAGTFLCDTPGFGVLTVWEMEKEELRRYYPELAPFEGQCRFQGCTHTREPGCRVKEAAADGRISRIRYESYLGLYEELKARKKY